MNTIRNFGKQDPHWVDKILEWPGTWPFARLALSLLFIASAAIEIADFPNAVAAQEQAGLKPGAAWALLTIFVQVAGSALVVSGRLVWLGAGMLGVFTALTDVLVHRFWIVHGTQRFNELNEFMEHLGLIGGFVLAALVADQKERSRRAQAQAAAGD